MADAIRTADLCDTHGDALQILRPGLTAFGGRDRIEGPIRTVRAYADNSRVRELLMAPSEGGVLVVDGGGAQGWALVGDRLAQSAVDQGWAGLVVHGCIRDVEVIRELPLGVWARGTHPRKTVKHGQGLVDVDVEFDGVRFTPGGYLYADPDGIVVAARRLDPDGA